MIPLVDDLLNRVSAAGILKLTVADLVDDLGTIPMWSHSTWVGSATVTANDLFGSLILLSGSGSRGVRFYNRTGRISGSSPLHNGGAFTLRAGRSHVSSVADLGVQAPSSAPVDNVSDVVPPTGTVTFTNHLSSLEWV